MTTLHQVTPRGPFDLAHTTSYFGEWVRTDGEGDVVVTMADVDGSGGSAAARLWQDDDGVVHGEVAVGPGVNAEVAWREVCASLSLDVDGAGWANVGERDGVVGSLQQEHGLLRPVLFSSPYEAAVAFLVGHRIRITQRQRLMQRMAEAIGEPLEVGGSTVHVLPGPAVLAELSSFEGLSETKVARLRSLGRVAVTGGLGRSALRLAGVDEAMTVALSLDGIGPFFAQGIVYRGVGVVDRVTWDEMSRRAIADAYGLDVADEDSLRARVDALSPYQMWAMVLLHIRLRREGRLRG